MATFADINFYTGIQRGTEGGRGGQREAHHQRW